MKYFIVDDSLSVVKILNRIVEEHHIGEVIGVSTDPETAVKEIILEEPDIVLVDYLMPQLDGISLVRKVREVKPRVKFIMLSQVSDKEMIAAAYKEGIQFFISKPINLIEVISVLKNVNEKVTLENTLGGIREIIQDKNTVEQNLNKGTKDKDSRLKEIKYLLGILGMLGESGTSDIIAICEERLQNNGSNIKEGVALYCSQKSEEPKMVKQRIRRAVKRGLTNIAAMGVEDYYNEVFQNYHYVVFDFESIRAEMDHLRGKRKDGGKANVDKFIEGLLVYSEIK
ncbi:DNA-binding domain-containing protein [Aminipila sp.]|uniref:DNA-binding domain-containing protein n=1 Tax=Aminipila sp. TaxID=2060095 RepID=UPI001DFC12FB|nr:DNA-binding domain-containing protein [Aminipila sp.]MBE6034451.1 response regulator [Clostridiales bacterium]